MASGFGLTGSAGRCVFLSESEASNKEETSKHEERAPIDFRGGFFLSQFISSFSSLFFPWSPNSKTQVLPDVD